MDSTQKIQFDENLSDDLLNEKVTTCCIRSSAKILINMSQNSLTNKKIRKNSYMNDNALVHFQEGEKELEEPPRLGLNKQKLVSSENERRVKNAVFQASYKKSSTSLKQEISNLLKYAAQIRNKKMLKSCDSQEAFRAYSKNTVEDLPLHKRIVRKDAEPS
ncbi:unnamed protein product [Moneuplotes crassus]|uniref:Uncharacterized protein n=1 Tax=Euplotes crassus TaxID=5936 RepID=A0AAD1XEN7_EUPCR|nr:unnamed protein product [Moneuplotes crassus]